MADHPFSGTLSVTDKIGIGKEYPSAQLDIFSLTAPSQIFLESGGTLLKLTVDANGAAIGTDSAFPLSIKTDDISRISIDKVGNISFSGALSVQNTLTVSGNVGIGTTSPSYKLAIAAGDINIDDGRALRQAGRWIIGGDSNVLSIGSSNAPDGRDIRLDPGFSGALTVKKDTGNVGIGTSSPGSPLEIVSIQDSILRLRQNESGHPWNYIEWCNSNSRLWWSGTTPGNTFAIGTDLGGGQVLSLTTSGNVGIGTSSPGSPLEIVSTQDSILRLRQNESGHPWNYIEWCNSNSRLWWSGTTPGNTFAIGTDLGGGQVLSLTTSGNVGIGTDEATQRLTIAGGNVAIDYNRVFGFIPQDKFIYDGKEMGHYSLGWFSDSWDFGASTAWLSGYLGIKLFTRGELRFWVDGVGNVRYAKSLERSSSRKLKESIAALPAQEAIDALEGLNPVKYNLKADKEKNLHIGFIAEDVPDLVASCDRKAISTDHIVAVLTKVVKEQQKTISVLAEKIKALEKQN